MTTQSTDSSATTDEHRNRNTERAQLHSTIWRIANDLRGSVDGWDFKQYVLGMLFYRYLSERLVKHLSDASSGGNYAALSDSFIDAEGKRDVIKNLGFFLLPSELFSSVHAAAQRDDNLNETLHKVFKSIESSAEEIYSENNLKGLFDDFVLDSNKLGATATARHETLKNLWTLWQRWTLALIIRRVQMTLSGMHTSSLWVCTRRMRVRAEVSTTLHRKSQSSWQRLLWTGVIPKILVPCMTRRVVQVRCC